MAEELIKECHRMIKDNTSDVKSEWFRIGDYKLRPNEVGGMQTTPPEEVEKKMKILLAEYISKQEIVFEDVLDFHQQFESIHPFQDGNVTMRHQQKVA